MAVGAADAGCCASALGVLHFPVEAVGCSVAGVLRG